MFSPKGMASSLDTRTIPLSGIKLNGEKLNFSQTNGLPPAGILISPIRNQTKQMPQYDDFMNSVFSNKMHKSYYLCEKADLRSKVLEPKFKYSLNKGGDDIKRIQSDYEEQL